MGMMQLQGTNKCVHVAGKGESGAPLELRECENEATELWTFEEVIASSSSSSTFLRHLMIPSLGMAALGALIFSAWLRQWQKTGRMERTTVGHVEEGGVSLSEPIRRLEGVPAVMALSPAQGDDDKFVQSASRRAVVMGTIALGASATTQSASAGYATNLGLGAGTLPQDAEVDYDLFKTKQVQVSLKKIKEYQSTAKSMKVQFMKNTTMNLIPTIRKEFDFSKVRDDFNNVTTIFDDETQKTIDRSTRAILFDLTELENAARLKKGVETRTDKQVERVEEWFKTFDRDITKLLKYFPAPVEIKEPPKPPPEPVEAPAEAPDAGAVEKVASGESVLPPPI
jgi:hypothetical protein